MYFRIYIYKFNNQNSLELNNMFRQPLSENEVIRATKSAEKVYKDQNNDYKYKNETLINLLEITEEEQKEMKTIISDEEYKIRKRLRDREYQKKKYDESLKIEGKLTEKEKISQRRIKIKDLLREGLKQKDICLQLDISKDTYLRDRKYLKEQGLI